MAEMDRGKCVRLRLSLFDIVACELRAWCFLSLLSERDICLGVGRLVLGYINRCWFPPEEKPYAIHPSFR